MKKLMLIMTMGGASWLVPSTAFAYSDHFTVTNNSTVEQLTMTRRKIMTGYDQHGDWHCSINGYAQNPSQVVLPPQSSMDCGLTTTSNQINEAFTLTGNLSTTLFTPLDSSSNYEVYCGLSGAPTYCTSGMATQRIFHQNGNIKMTSPNSSLLVYQSDSCPDIQTASDMVNNNFPDGSCPTNGLSTFTIPDTQGRAWQVACSSNVTESLTSFTGLAISVNPSAGTHAHIAKCTYTDSNQNFNVTLVNRNQQLALPMQNAINWTVYPGADSVSGSAACQMNEESSSTTACQWAYAAESY